MIRHCEVTTRAGDGGIKISERLNACIRFQRLCLNNSVSRMKIAYKIRIGIRIE